MVLGWKRPGTTRASGGLDEPAFGLDEARNLVDAIADAQIGEHERALAAHASGVAVHHLERRADMRREVDLVDDQQVASG